MFRTTPAAFIFILALLETWTEGPDSLTLLTYFSHHSDPVVSEVSISDNDRRA